MGTATPHAATSGPSTSETLSPTPPVECLSMRGEFLALEAAHEHRHQQRRDLIVGDAAGRVFRDERRPFFGTQRPTVALALDQGADDHSRMFSILLSLLVLQNPVNHIVLGDSAGLMHPDVQLRHYQAALAIDSLSYEANWDDAVKQLETAVRLAPKHIYHRLELAEVYTDLGRYSKAREQCQAIAALPEVDVMDAQYKKDAADLLADIKNEKDET